MKPNIQIYQILNISSSKSPTHLAAGVEVLLPKGQHRHLLHGYALFFLTDVGHCWDSSKVIFQSWNKDMTFGHNFLQFTKISAALWKGCWKTHVFKPFGLITMVWYHLSNAILSIFLGYRWLYYKSNNTYPQDSKYMQTLLYNLLSKRHYIFLHSIFQNCYYIVLYILMPASWGINSTRSWVVCALTSTVPGGPTNVWWMNEWMNGWPCTL